jgi:steroid delta-isomerase-like uncharacterized protein
VNALVRPFRWLATTSLFRSLRFRLILLVLLASLPSLALLLITAAQQRDVAIDTGQDEARRLARLVASDQSSVSSSIVTVLNSLAISTELRADDPDGCGMILRSLGTGADATGEPGTTAGATLTVDGATFSQVVVLDDKLSTWCSGPAGPGLISDDDRALAQSALDTGTVAAGNYASSTLGSMVVSYAVPVPLEGSTERRVILAQLNVHSLLQFASEIALPKDSFIVIFDREGRLEQRYPTLPGMPVGSPLIGTPVVDETIGRASTTDETSKEQLEEESEDIVFATDTFVTPGADGSTQLAYAMVGFPESVVVQRANDKFTENLGKLGIAGIVALVAAWVGADLFVGRDAEARKGLIRDFYHAFSTGSISELDQIVGPGYVDRTAAPNQAAGIAGLRQNIAAFRTAFPDGRIIIRELIADHDKVVARVTLTGTHVADYFGIPPSGKHMVADGIETFRFMHGMVVESWSMFGDLKQREKAIEDVAVPRQERPGLLRRLVRRRVKSTATGVHR